MQNDPDSLHGLLLYSLTSASNALGEHSRTGPTERLVEKRLG